MPVNLYERDDSEFTLNSTTTGVQSLPKISWISSSRYIAVWTHDPFPGGVSNPQIRAQIFESDGTPVGAEFTVNVSDVAEQTNAVVAQLAGGGFVIAWEDRNVASDGSGSSIIYQVFTADGLGVGTQRVANTTVSFDQSRPSIAGLDGGGFVITWTDGSMTGGDTSGLAVRGQLFSANGDVAGSEFLVNTITSRGQTASNVTALDGGGFAVLWQDESPQGVFNGSVSREDHGTDIALQIFDSAANKVGGQKVVDENEPAPVFIFSDSGGRITAQNPVATLLADGKLAVVWADASDGYVRTRILNADGTPATAIQNVGDGFGTVHPAPSIVALANGGYAVSWTMTGEGPPDASGQGVLARVFGADGSPQGTEFQVNSTTQGNQLASTMLAFDDGGFLVAWHDGTTTDLAAQRFGEDSGVITDIALSVGSISRASIENVQAAILTADGALNADFTYQLLSDPTGAFRIEGDRLVVADTALLFGYGPNQATLTLRVTDANGNSFDEAIQIPLAAAPASAVFVAGDQTLISLPPGNIGAQTAELLALPDGGYFMTWVEVRQSTGNLEVMGQFHEADGSTGPALVINTVTANNQFEPIAALLADGNIVVTWSGPPSPAVAGNLSDIRAQILTSTGAKVGGEFVVNSVTAQSQTRGVPTALAGGGFLVTWADASLASDPSSTGIKAQFFTAAGAKVGGEFLVNTTTAGAQTSPYSAQLDNGTIVIAWTDASATGGDTSGTAVRARLYSAAGAPLGGEFLVNTTTLYSQSAPVVTLLADGRFVIVWGDTSEGTGSTGAFDPADIRAQIYDSAGNRIGGEILVNTETLGFQGQGSLGAAGVAANSDGGFVVTWASYGQVNSDGDSGAIKAQLFGADGGKVGSEFLVNQIGQGQQGTPAVAILGDGDMVFTWWDLSGSRTGDSRGISSRRFDSMRAALPYAVIEGTEGDDDVTGTSGPDLMLGYGGHDTLAARAGDDTLHGGDGDDFLQGEDGNDQLFGDEGYDLLRGGAGVDHFDGGADGPEQGGDRISFFEQRATQGVVADLRTGIISNDGFGNAETMENVESLGGDTAYVDTFYGNDGANFLSAGRGDNLYGFGGADVLQLVAAAAVVDGGAGVDMLRLVSHQTGYLPDSNGDGNAELAPAMTTGYVVNLAAGTLRDGYGNVGTVTGIENLSGSQLGDDLRGDSGDNVILGNAGNDILRLQDGGNDNVSAGDGNDNIFFIGALTSADIVDGGAGVDTLVLQGPYGALILAPTVNQIENISLLGGNNVNFGEPGTNRYDYSITTNDLNFAAGVQARINGSALLAGEDFTFNGSAETNASFVVYGGKGVDTLTGGLGNDIFFYAEERFASGDTVNGGAGYDGMFLRGNYTIDFNAPGYTGLFTNIENLTLTSATDERYARGGGTEFDYSLTLSDAIVNAGQTLTVSGALLMATETMFLDGSLETNGLLRLFGGKAADTLKGGAQADLIHGNMGGDILSGGGGADVFRYDSTAESSVGTPDQITDFTPGTDKIDLSRIDANTLTAGDQAFSWIGSSAFSGAGAASAGQLRAYQSSGTWFVEGDTNGDGAADIVIALTLQGPTPLSAGDFIP